MIKQIINKHPQRKVKNNKHINAVEAQPFIQWVGGKRVLIDQYDSLFPKDFNDYWEPFLGGGAVFYHMVKKYPNKKFYLSDFNEELIMVYEAIKSNPNEVVSLISEMNLRHSKDFYYAIRNLDRETKGKKSVKLFNVKDKLAKEEVAARFVYLNKTCFNALWRVNSQGLNNVPMGTSLSKNIEDNGNILLCSNVLKNVSLKSGPYTNILSSVKEGDFVYLDPPYHPLTNTSNFTSYTELDFSEKDQKDLKNFCDNLHSMNVKFLLSNSNCDFIKNLYSQYEQHKFSVARTLNSNKDKRTKESAGFNEIVIRNF